MLAMFKLLAKEDEWLIERVFQRGANWWQEMTGQNNFVLARIVLVVSVIAEKSDAILKPASALFLAPRD